MEHWLVSMYMNLYHFIHDEGGSGNNQNYNIQIATCKFLKKIVLETKIWYERSSFVVNKPCCMIHVISLIYLTLIDNTMYTYVPTLVNM